MVDCRFVFLGRLYNRPICDYGRQIICNLLKVVSTNRLGDLKGRCKHVNHVEGEVVIFEKQILIFFNVVIFLITGKDFRKHFLIPREVQQRIAQI